MAGLLQTSPWGVAPFGAQGSFPSVPVNPGALSYLLQQLQFVPQQLQQVQQAAYVQQQLLQQILHALQNVPQQVQHILQAAPFSGLSTGTPLQSPVFGNPLYSMQPLTGTQFSLGQPGYVM
jgi:Na+-translocating ferredoxin:NAD+ oxidoreductase RnfD subunit